MLTPTQYANADAFLHAAQSALMQNEAANNLMLGVCLRLRDYPERIKAAPLLFTIESGPHQIELAAVMTPPHNLIVHCVNACDQVILDLLADHLITNQWAIPGVIGALPGSEQFAMYWAQRTGCKVRLNMSERTFELRTVIAPQPVPGRLRQADENDLPLLIEWVQDFHREALCQEMPLDQAQKLVAVHIENRHLFVWDANGIVSMAGVSRPTPNGITVTLVYTPPRLRGQGYASNCVAALSQLMLDEGRKFCTLFTNLANPTSNDIYQQIGYRPVADFNEYRFEND
jgi:predicted GNAT family acetyltransferase